jgi:hypothetical protein
VSPVFAMFMLSDSNAFFSAATSCTILEFDMLVAEVSTVKPTRCTFCIQFIMN